MTYRGHIENGAVVLDEPVELPEGTRVTIDVCPMSGNSCEEATPSLAETLAPFIGKAIGLPEDAAENHDHYLYGTARK